MTGIYYQTCKPYLERAALARDLAAHLQARQHTGKVVVLTDSPQILLSNVRKHWLRLAREVQKQRSSTLNADKILRFTHAISHMQFMDFSLQPPSADPDAQIYLLRANELAELPLDCHTVYFTHMTPLELTARIARELPSPALLVDFTGRNELETLELQPKTHLDQQVSDAWRELTVFLNRHHINIEHIANHDLTALEDALDTVLGVYHEFLQLALHLQRAIDMAQPVPFSHGRRRQFELCSMLAYRVQSLTRPINGGSLSPDFTADHAFFLHNPWAEESLPVSGLAEEVQRHIAAGRVHLAAALQQASGVLLLETQACL